MSQRRYSGVPLDDQLDEEFIDQRTELSENYNDAMVYERRESPTQNCCKMSKLTKCNCSFLSKCSKTANIVTAIVILIVFKGFCVGLGYLSIFVLKPTPVLDKSYRAFTIPNHEASLNYEAFKLASSHNVTHSFSHFGRKKRSVSDRDFNPFLETESQTKALHRSKRQNIYRYPDQSKVQWKLQVIFLAVGDDEKNIFTKDRLEYIHTIERRIMNHTRFYDFCFKDSVIAKKDPALKTIGGCAPLNSLMQYFYPTIDVNENIHYDGLGSMLADIKSTIEFAMATSDHFYYYVDQNVNKTHHKSRLLRTEILFGSPLKGYSSSFQQRKEQAEKYKEFVLTYIDMLSSSSTDKVKILYGGNEIFDYEVNQVFWNDVKLASFSLAAIFIFMLILTSFSLWLTFFGIASILLCFPLAVFFYHNVFGIAAFGILNGVAAFVIIGIGVDDVFVFINIFRQATNMKTTEARIKHTLVTAGKATFITSFTTAAAFAANTASSIPAVHQFGLFMSLIVSCCWITVLAVMLPALYIWGVGIQRWEEKCFSRINYWIFSKLQFKKRDLPEDIVAFVGGNQSQSTEQQIRDNLPAEEDDDDVPLLTLDDPMEYYIERYGAADDDEVLLIPDHRNLSPHDFPQTSHDKVQQSSLMQMLQAGLYHYVALPVIKIRRVFIGLSLLLLIVSIVLITRIHPSTKPPQLFKESTNLEMLMDLKTSVGIIDEISCSKCSAIYDVDDHYTPFHSYTRHTGYKTTMSPRKTTMSSPRQTTTTTKTTQRTFHPTKSSAVAPEFKKKPTNQTGFIGEKVMFMCAAKGYPTPVIKWQKDGKKIPGNSYMSKEGTLVMNFVTKEDQGMYTCIATNWAGHNIAVAYLMITDSSGHLLYPITSPPIVTRTPQLISHSSAPPKSLPENFDMCKNTDCTKTNPRPMLETGASVYVVFGIDGLDRSNIEPGHVMEKTKGKVLFDPSFNHHFKFLRNPGIIEGIAKLCSVCKEITAKTDLVKNGSAQCFPSTYEMPWDINRIPECHDLPSPVEVYGRQAHAHVIGGVDRNGTGLLWWAFSFESTTSKSQSYFDAYKEYLKWEELITKIRTDLKSTPYLQSIFQTSEFWPQVMMEVVAVNSAIYSLVLSMVICLVSVAIFSGHVMLLFIVFVTILEMICLVTGIFYLAGWEMGGVEAISLSILVGSSVDYCVHLVEGFLLAGKAVPDHLKYKNAASRQWRTKAAISHIGVSIFSSAITTIVAAIPLTQATIQPFAKFGQILAINSTVSIIYCLTVCSALLAFMGPSRFISSWKSTLKMTIGTCVVVGSSTLLLFVISKSGVFIPGPNGAALFPN